MVELAREYPQFSADLMRHHRRARQLPEARSYARKYLRYIGDLQQKASELTAVEYANWSQAEQLMGHDKEAMGIARGGFTKFPDEPILKNLVGAALLLDLASMDPNSPKVLPTLKAAHIADRGNLEIAKRLATKLVYDEFNVRPVINELKEENRCAPEVFLLAGDLHAGGRRWTKAKSMYEEAIEVDDNCSTGRNNVAWILANIPPVRLTEALELINTAIQTDGDGQCYETRGQIYVKMGRWKEAEKDLQRALNGFLPEDDRIRADASLSEVYEKLEQIGRAHV
jgi:tetratricopeptide (TPR) repeat protein